MRRHNEHDEWIRGKLQELSSMDPSLAAKTTASKFKFDNDFLRYKSRIMISPTSPWKAKIIEEHHDTPIAGHQGELKTYQRIKKGFYWPSLKKDIKSYVA